MSIEEFWTHIIEDIAVDLADEFDKNFVRKGFFNKKWKPTNHHNSRGSLMLRTGKLRRSINLAKGRQTLRFTSSVPYAKLMNEGGVIVVTRKMQKFFWAMFYETVEKVGKTKKPSKRLNQEARKWKALALTKVGTKFTIEQRQYIGWHPQVDKIVKQNVDFALKELNKQILKQLRQ